MKDGEEINLRTFMHNPRMWKTMRALPWGGGRMGLSERRKGRKVGTTVKGSTIIIKMIQKYKKRYIKWNLVMNKWNKIILNNC